MLVEAVREGHASRGFIRDALGLSVGQADDLLASRGVLYDFTQEELEREAGVIAARRS